MKEFMLLFRHVPGPDFKPTPEEMGLEIKKWQDWIGGIASQGKFVGTNQLTSSGKLVRPGNVISDGPYAEVKEILGGYMMVKAENYDEAVEMAKGCPTLGIGGSVEVRDFVYHEHLN